MFLCLFIYCFASHLRMFHLYGAICHHYRCRTAKFRPMLGSQGFWAGKEYLLWHGTSNFPIPSERTAPFSRLLWQTRRCGGPTLTRTPTEKMQAFDYACMWPYTLLDGIQMASIVKTVRSDCKQFFFPSWKNRIRLWHGYIYEAVEREKRCFCCFKHNNSVII
jgi:hypothetical protein